MSDYISRVDAVPQMEHDREWIIGCIKHDGFIKTDRFDTANQIILDALEPQTDTDLISRADVWRKLQTLDMQELYLPIHFKELVLDEVPSVSAERVVRCKDCEYYKCCEVFNPKKITENDFCSWAKMKGGAE